MSRGASGFMYASISLSLSSRGLEDISLSSMATLQPIHGNGGEHPLAALHTLSVKDRAQAAPARSQ